MRFWLVRYPTYGKKIGGRDRDRTCDLIHAMDALSQLSYTPVTKRNCLRMVRQTANILTNIPNKFHSDGAVKIARVSVTLPHAYFAAAARASLLCIRVPLLLRSAIPAGDFSPVGQKLPLECRPYAQTHFSRRGRHRDRLEISGGSRRQTSAGGLRPVPGLERTAPAQLESAPGESRDALTGAC